MIKILVEPSDYTLFNIGDTAMLQIAVKRLKALFPDSAIKVFTRDPQALKFYCPDAIPISAPRRLEGRYTLAPVYKYLEQDRITRYLCSFVRIFRHRVPAMAKYVIEHLLKESEHLSEELQRYLRAVAEADLVVVSGMGGITDNFLLYAHGLMDTLGLAIYFGVPTAMLGQGIGPIKNPQLISRSTEIFPYVRLFSLREGRAGPSLLKSLGVSPERILVTGDDAIEVAYRLRSETLGNGLGVNLRAADYSQVDRLLIRRIRPVIQKFASLNRAPLIPVPISRVSGEEDLASIRHIVVGYRNVLGLNQDFSTQEKVIRQILHCRVVMTGSYHAAVFALGMGIPAVCLAKSEYYVDKFLGLAELFNTGCQVVLLDDPQMSAKLQSAIQNLWESAEQVRPSLLKAAEDQIEWSHAAYQRLYKVVGYKPAVQKAPLKTPILSN
ncbi:MAG TPA: polysaccharide pyruvyl transferase family protein [Anaerolineales bacterium]|nr:polysaccharide pyruvyl transferase family protein [Anaerolineales bacterium]